MNLVKMNLYRFCRKIQVYVAMLFMVGITFFVVADARDESESYKELQREIMEENISDDGQVYGLTVNVNDDYTIEQVISDLLSSQLLLVFIVIFVCSFVGDERSHGFIKNLNACTNSKIQLFLSKIPVVAVYAALLEIGVVVGAFISGAKALSISISELCIFLSLQWLLHVSFGVFALLLMELVRNQLVGVVVGIASAVSIPTLIISTVTSRMPVINRYSGFEYSLVSPMIKMFNITINPDILSMWPKALISAMVLGISYAVLGSVSAKKRDLC